MALYSLTYDLRNSRNYQQLYNELKRFSSVRILESTWCFKRFNTSPEGLRNHFKQYIDGDDAVIVSEISDWASFNTDGTPNELS